MGLPMAPMHQGRLVKSGTSSSYTLQQNCPMSRSKSDSLASLEVEGVSISRTQIDAGKEKFRIEALTSVYITRAPGDKGRMLEGWMILSFSLIALGLAGAVALGWVNDRGWIVGLAPLAVLGVVICWLFWQPRMYTLWIETVWTAHDLINSSDMEELQKAELAIKSAMDAQPIPRSDSS